MPRASRSNRRAWAGARVPSTSRGRWRSRSCLQRRGCPAPGSERSRYFQRTLIGGPRQLLARSGDQANAGRDSVRVEKVGRIVLGHTSRFEIATIRLRLEQATGIAPVTPVRHTDVSLQHFACLVVSSARHRFCGSPWAARVQRPVTLFVPPSGIEPEPLELQSSAQPCTPERGLRAPRTCFGGTHTAQIIIIVLRLSEIRQTPPVLKIWSADLQLR